ncbi:MAG: helix-turn-helix transcriptional regulator [Acidiferrobacterales bacterium]|nr:helix-turn-helix transcriptional regulator [Acidiferrobacterales bacterium]
MKINKFTPETDILKEFGKRLARIRKAQGYTQTELAQEAGIGVATIRRIEGGQVSQLETWLKLFKALDMSSNVDALLPETFNSPMAEALAGKSRKRKNPSSPSGIMWGDETG